MDTKFVITGTDGYRLFRDIQGDILPAIGTLINQLILEGKKEEEIRAAVQTAARSYQALAMAFIGQD